MSIIGNQFPVDLIQYSASRYDYINTGNPAIDTNPDDVGANWLNVSTGEIWVCTDNTPDANEWFGSLNGWIRDAWAVDPFNLFDFEDSSSYPGTGSTVYDLGSAGMNGVFQNGAAYSASPNKSMELQGTDDKLQFGDVAEGTVATNWTMEAWAMPNATHTHVAEDVFTTTDWRALHEIRTGTTGNPGLGLSMGTNGIMAIALKPGNAHSIVSYAATFPSTTFTHVVVVVNGNRGSLYVNGAFIKEGTVQADTMQWRGQCIGYSAYGDFSGKVAQAAVYPRVLTATEILSNYNYGSSYLSV